MEHRKFCSFIYSQQNNGEGAILRRDFCRRLMKYAGIDCPGKGLHNMDREELTRRHADDWHASKIRFLGQYKFNIAFENCNSHGYITEKLTDAFLANTIPIYWGSEGDLAPFPKDAVVLAQDYPDEESLVARIREINENDAEYLRILSANPFRNGFRIDKWEEFSNFLLSIAARSRKRPAQADPIGHSDVAFFRDFGQSKVVLFFACLHILSAYGWGRLQLLFSPRNRDLLEMKCARIRWFAHLAVHHLLGR